MSDQSMQDKIVLVTGGTGGIGQETALGLAKLGATVIITGRDKNRGEAAVADLKARSGNPLVELMLADLSSQAEVRRLAEEFQARYPRLDVLINNVGGLYHERWLTADGIEATFAMNHLNSFLLTHLLLPTLKASAPARVINVTGGMPDLKIDLDNLQAEKKFLGLQTYSHAKAVMMAASYEFARRLEGTGVTLNVAYPGAAATAMTGAMRPSMMPVFMRLLWPVFKPVMSRLKPERASRSSIYLASTPQVEGANGNYYNTKSQQVSWPKYVYDEALRRRIWEISERLTQARTAVSR